MSELFATGRVVDLILALVLVEVILLVSFRRKTGRGLGLAEVAGSLLAGAFLLLALRGALVGAAWPWIAASLFAALVAHLVDLAGRTPR